MLSLSGRVGVSEKAVAHRHQEESVVTPRPKYIAPSTFDAAISAIEEAFPVPEATETQSKMLTLLREATNAHDLGLAMFAIFKNSISRTEFLVKITEDDGKTEDEVFEEFMSNMKDAPLESIGKQNRMLFLVNTFHTLKVCVETVREEMSLAA